MTVQFKCFDKLCIVLEYLNGAQYINVSPTIIELFNYLNTPRAQESG